MKFKYIASAEVVILTSRALLQQKSGVRPRTGRGLEGGSRQMESQILWTVIGGIANTSDTVVSHRLFIVRA